MNLIRLSIWMVCLAFVAPVRAADVPWPDRPYSHVSREEGLVELLRDFTAACGLSAVISDRVAGTVSGQFRNVPPQRFLDSMASAHGLSWYYDGSVLYVYRSDEVASGMLKLENAGVDKLEAVLRRLEIYDPRFPLKSIPEEGILYVAGPPRYIELVKGAAGLLDEEGAKAAQDAAGKEVIRVFPLKYAAAADQTFTHMDREVMVPGVATILGQILIGKAPPANVSGRQERQLSRTVSKLKGEGLAAVGKRDEAEDKGGDPGPGSQAEKGRKAPFAPSVQADPRMNAVIIRDLAENMPYYGELVSILDVAPGLVEIQATIVDINSTYARKLGTDWRFNWQTDDLAGETARMDGGFDAGEGFVFDGGGLGLGEGLNYATVLGDAAGKFLILRLKALQESGNAHILSRPSILTLNNTEAVLDHIKTFYVKVAGNEEVDLFNVSAGIVLKVTPHIIEEASGTRIKLVVKIEDGDVLSTTVDGIPVIQESTLTTQATIGENQSILIGGYTRQNVFDGEAGIPCLGRVPLLGMLFKQKSTETEESERYFLLTPRIVRHDDYPDLSRLMREPLAAPEGAAGDED